ncbi:hypothetical protein, partial [Bacillus sp. REN3]|uniref:hypothetical protein n=1 Tax=Bacillus sp. REN3 TaxID=2802440 RepID=UPI001AEDCE61
SFEKSDEIQKGVRNVSIPNPFCLQTEIPQFNEGFFLCIFYACWLDVMFICGTAGCYAVSHSTARAVHDDFFQSE